MSKQHFEQLLAGATPGPWKTLPEERHCNYIRIRGTVLGARYKIANVHNALECEAGEARNNAELIARCNPATMKVVWEALAFAGTALVAADPACPVDSTAEKMVREAIHMTKAALRALNAAHPESKQP